MVLGPEGMSGRVPCVRRPISIGLGLDPFLAVRASDEVFVFKGGSSDGINDRVGSMGCSE
jgi:hypothetical protein